MGVCIGMSTHRRSRGAERYGAYVARAGSRRPAQRTHPERPTVSFMADGVGTAYLGRSFFAALKFVKAELRARSLSHGVVPRYRHAPALGRTTVARMAVGRAQILLIFTVVWSDTALPLASAVGSLHSDGTPGALTSSLKIPSYRTILAPYRTHPRAAVPPCAPPRAAPPRPSHPFLRSTFS